MSLESSPAHETTFQSKFSESSQILTPPVTHRVRFVARKRRPLAIDLKARYLDRCRGKLPALTSIGRWGVGRVKYYSECDCD